MLDFQQLNKIKKEIVIGLFLDDSFLDLFVLKGGTAIDYYDYAASRSSIDIDISLDGDFDDDLFYVQSILEKRLTQQLKAYHLFDFKLKRKRIMKLLTFRDLNEKENNFFSNCFKNMDNSILKKLIFESVNMVKNKN